jgi:hypothetical protein
MPDAEESMTCPRTATKTHDLVQGGQTFEAYSAIRLDDSVIEVFYFLLRLSCFRGRHEPEQEPYKMITLPAFQASF